MARSPIRTCGALLAVILTTGCATRAEVRGLEDEVTALREAVTLISLDRALGAQWTVEERDRNSCLVALGLKSEMASEEETKTYSMKLEHAPFEDRRGSICCREVGEAYWELGKGTSKGSMVSWQPVPPVPEQGWDVLEFLDRVEVPFQITLRKPESDSREQIVAVLVPMVRDGVLVIQVRVSSFNPFTLVRTE